MQGKLGGVIFLLVVLGTVFFIFAKAPEDYSVTSSDSRVGLHGDFSASTQIEIETAGEISGTFTAALLPAYRFYPALERLDRPLTLTLSYQYLDLAGSDPHSLRLGFYDQEKNIWRMIPTNISLSKQTLEVSVQSLNHLFAPLLLDSVGRPDFLEEIDGLIAAAPEDAVGYELVVSYAQVPGDFVELVDYGKIGGCNGQFQFGDQTSMTGVNRVFSAELEYAITVFWELKDGCGPRQMIE